MAGGACRREGSRGARDEGSDVGAIKLAGLLVDVKARRELSSGRRQATSGCEAWCPRLKRVGGLRIFAETGTTSFVGADSQCIRVYV